MSNMIEEIMFVSIMIFLLALILVYIYFRVDIRNYYANLRNLDGIIFQSSSGKIEYLCKGKNEPVLICHGMAGGFDQALETGKGLVGGDYKIIAVSRFGYLNSDLPEEGTPENQAISYCELLDHLQINKVVVIAVSAGSAPAIKFALKYPERTKALILIGAGAPSKKEIKGLTGPPHFIIRDFVFWLMLKYIKFAMLPIMFGISKKTYNKASPEEKRKVDSLLKTILPIRPRKLGMINDEKVTNLDMIVNNSKYELENIKVPTLVIHSMDDPLASFEESKEMAKRIPNSKFVTFENGGHLIFGHSKEVEIIIDDFIEGNK